jgi:hypothetical protein
MAIYSKWLKGFYIRGIKVIPGEFGIKIYTKNKSLADLIWRYYCKEYLK